MRPRADTDRELGFSRTFDDPGPPTSLIVLISQWILSRSGPERHRLHRECGRTSFHDRCQVAPSAPTEPPTAASWRLVDGESCPEPENHSVSGLSQEGGFPGGSLGMVQKRRFSGNTRNFSADPDRSRVGAGFRESLAAVLGLQFRENRVYPRSSSQCACG